jgi:3-methyladenine DNA glycosylase AlkD
MSYKKIHQVCLSLKDEKRSIGVARYFKTGKGEYGEGDTFYGLSVPTSRSIARDFKELSFAEVEKLFHSPIHEERLIGIHILNLQYTKAVKMVDLKIQKHIYKSYFKWRSGINNWDLVDSSAPYLSGHFYFHYDTKDLFKLVKSKKLWERRIAVLSCFYFIRQKDFSIPLKIIETRLYDKEDLMHKACGWMLREIGTRDAKLLRDFLKDHAHSMPRTALRYSIEKFSETERKKWLGQKNR